MDLLIGVVWRSKFICSYSFRTNFIVLILNVGIRVKYQWNGRSSDKSIHRVKDWLEYKVQINILYV